MSDQGSEQESGKFLGWRMKFWGTTIDPSQAEKYEVPLVEDVLPPANDPYRPVVATPTVTNVHKKPDHFDHDPSAVTSKPTAKIHNGNDSLLSDVCRTFGTHKTLCIGVGAVALIGLLTGAVLLRRRAQSLEHYTLAIENPQMAAPGTASFGPERAGLGRSPGGRHPQDRVAVGLGFHSSFLDDDDLSTAGSGLPPKYRDEPNQREDGVGPVASTRFVNIPEVRVSSPRTSSDQRRD